ncbi:hypothetical protein P8A22_14965 [Streptomyces laculatispora]|uniref:Integral membrane protein n=1 Tax=Streptomyces laculatispora TaxID=887464 RepID=A0ABY9I3S1_9ACTN|nr:hypothetical protein [Streptomyces laculatispora]WLQ41171.1 hypothetical protein P8A22_14965 [Streptomyces laculatispora]
MPDRRRRTAFRHPLPEPAPLLMRERQSPAPGSSSSPSSSSSGSSGSSGTRPEDDNPFAPPPENRPDQPWQPRHPANGGTNGNGENNGDGGDSPEGGSPDNRPVWGSQWSSHQPGRQSGGFGGQPAGPAGPNGQGGGRGGPEGKSGGARWDPTDPVQRRARYSLLAGMWAFFFAIFDLPEIALLLGALATYWSISALRAKPKDPSTTGGTAGSAAAPGAAAGAHADAQGQGTGPGTAAGPAHTPGSAAAPGAPGTGVLQRGSRQQTTAAVSGLVTALIALAIVATSFTVQLVYRDYYTCVNDALTKSGQVACNDLLPKPLEPLFGVKK